MKTNNHLYNNFKIVLIKVLSNFNLRFIVLNIYIIIIGIVTINAQDTSYLPSSDCENYNSFLSSSAIFNNSHLIAPEVNGTIYTDLVDKDSLNIIIDGLGLDENTSFQFKFSGNNLNDTLFYFSRFQQYFNGIMVEGAGFTANYIRVKPSGDPNNPCDKLFSIAPRILSGINVNTTPAFS
ncbi:MAG: hypothetical protein ABI851_16190 [Saprospiraceae bacterium]